MVVTAVVVVVAAGVVIVVVVVVVVAVVVRQGSPDVCLKDLVSGCDSEPQADSSGPCLILFLMFRMSIAWRKHRIWYVNVRYLLLVVSTLYSIIYCILL